MDYLLFIMFGYGFYICSKDLFKLILSKYTNIKLDKKRIYQDIQVDFTIFSILLFLFIYLFNKNSLVLVFIIMALTSFVLFVELKKGKFI